LVDLVEERFGKKSQVGIGDIHLELPAVNLELCSEMNDFGRPFVPSAQEMVLCHLAEADRIDKVTDEVGWEN